MPPTSLAAPGHVNVVSRMNEIRIADTPSSQGRDGGRARGQGRSQRGPDERLGGCAERTLGMPPQADVAEPVEIADRAHLHALTLDHHGSEVVDDPQAVSGPHPRAE